MAKICEPQVPQKWRVNSEPESVAVSGKDFKVLEAWRVKVLSGVIGTQPISFLHSDYDNSRGAQLYGGVGG